MWLMWNLVLLLTTVRGAQLGNTKCNDTKSSCPDNTTCCLMVTKEYGCCPVPTAICCDDGAHCCPQDLTCDVEHHSCKSAELGISMSWADKKLSIVRQVSVQADKFCADNKTFCQQNDTCCNITKGFGCCPLSNATCCSDHMHCCPFGTHCDVPQKRCYKSDTNWEQSWVDHPSLSSSRGGSGKEPQNGNPSLVLNEGPSKVVDIEKLNEVVCPNSQLCSDGETCCKNLEESYSCCIYTDAVCCSDHIHCCPNGAWCDYSIQRCVGGGVMYSLAKIVQPKEKQDLRTQDVCCDEGAGCCPQGYTCDMATGHCQKEEISTPWFENQPEV